MTNTCAILLIIDGVSDVGTVLLDGRTPLQAARLPVLDALTTVARAGLIDPVRPGLACGSDTAHLSMFGYDPCTCYRGRGAFETIGAGLPMEAGDVAFKCNFAFMQDAPPYIVTRRCVDPHFHEFAKELCPDLDGTVLPSFPDVNVFVKHAGQHRLAISIRGPNLSDQVSNTDPLSDNMSLLTSTPSASTPEAERTAKVVNCLSGRFRQLLKQHPITKESIAQGKTYSNVVLLRGAAKQIRLPPFSEVNNLHAFMVAPTKIIAGIGQTVGIDLVSLPTATGGYTTDLNAKAIACVQRLARRHPQDPHRYEYDMGIVHVKAVDEAVSLDDVLATFARIDIILVYLRLTSFAD